MSELLSRRGLALALSGAVLLMGLLWLWPRGENTAWGAAARAYVEAASEYDYLGLYDCVDPAVLEREMAQAKLDADGVQARGEENRRRVEAFVADIERQYAVTLRWSYAFSGSEELTGDSLDALRREYAGSELTPKRARTATYHVELALDGRERAVLSQDWPITVVCLDGRWSVHQGELAAYEDLLRQLPGFAVRSFG